MPQPSTPREYVLEQLERLQATWSGVRDADTESVHDARVATRRIRAALPFVFSAPAAAAEELRRVGRALGRVRELDATYSLLAALEQKAPETAAAIAVLRRDVTHRLDRQRRRMIKALERHPRAIARAIEHGDRVARLSFLWRSWRQELRAAIQRRAADVQAAVDRATAVYMPNRSHSARIEIKKLRYTAELAASTGLLRNAEVLHQFTQGQKWLGALHDLHVLAVSIDETQFPGNASAESAVLASVIDVESARVHRKYVRNREQLRSACHACVADIHAGAESRAMTAAAILAVPVLAAWYFGSDGEERGGRIADEDRADEDRADADRTIDTAAHEVA